MIIKKLELYTSQLEEQIEFYSKILELPITSQSGNSVSFQVGHSILKFQYRKNCTPYHYAINIPSNKEFEALEWLKTRLEVLKKDNIGNIWLGIYIKRRKTN